MAHGQGGEIAYGRYRVLFVDDEPGNLTAFQFQFGDQFAVDVASSGEQALRMLVEQDYAVLLSDQKMPGMTGTDLCARAKALRPETVRMIVTAYGDLDAATQAINEGQVRRFLSKPWQEDEVSQSLRAAIDVHRFQEMLQDMERKLLRDERAAGRLLGAALLDHQIRNQVTSLVANVDALARIAPRIRDEVQSREIGEIAGDSEQALRTVANLLDAAKRGDVLRSDEKPDADVQQLARLSVQHLRTQMLRHAQPAIEVPDGLRAKIAPRELIHVLTNLLQNACQAIPEGEPARHRIEVRAEASGGRVRIHVSDTGSGIAPDDVGKIFELFFTTKRERGGSGLGLHIVKTIVGARDGLVSVKSAVGEGTTFSIDLPSA